MAEIAVERKNRFPWWAWLLIAPAALLMLWIFLAPERGTGIIGSADRERTTGEPIGDLAVIYSTNDPNALAGRSVHIEDARVLSVTGDKQFWVGPDENRRVLVILDEVPTPTQPRIEGRYDVNPGQNVTINGRVERFPGWEAAQARWNADPKLRSQYESQPVYIHADGLQITNSREANEPVQRSPRE
jgi:hypothetical protein